MSDKISEKKDKAVKAIRDYLVILLEEERWCEANTVGEFLRCLVSPAVVGLAELQMRAEQQMSETGRYNPISGIGK